MLIRVLLIGLLVLVCASWVGANDTIASVVATSGDTNESVVGDADCSGAADEADALAVIADIAALQGALCLNSGEVVCDGVVDLRDALALLTHAAGAELALPEGCPDPGEAMEGEAPATTNDLIGRALAQGAIDEETSVLYEIFAAFGDTRLPSRYAGHDEGEISLTGTFRDAVSHYETYSPATQEALYPYLLPPLHEDSWFAQRTGAVGAPARPADAQPAAISLPADLQWLPDPAKADSQASDTGKYKVWWPKARPEWRSAALQVLGYLDDGVVDDYSQVVSILGREPLGDGGFLGDDGAIDIFYYEEAASAGLMGWTLPYQWSDPAQRCKKTPTYIGINGYFKEQDNGVDLLRMTVSHEMFHAAQLAYDYHSGCVLNVKLKWLLEGTAKWFEDYRWPQANHQQHQWIDMFSTPSDGVDDPIRNREYSRYLVFMYLSRKYGPAIIPQIFEKMSTGTAVEAVQAVVPGGWNEFLPEFALYMSGKAPNDYFKQWDNISTTIRNRAMDYRRNANYLPTYTVLGQSESHREFTPT